ncbi:MAG: DUF5667 domain-containing protein [Patescibacteria group bacterium]
MTNFEKQLHTISRLISLTSAEKGEMRATLKRYMNMRPINQKHVYNTRLVMILFRNPISAFLVFTLFLGSGISFAAEGALPGSLLYPIKVSVNEEVRGALTISPEAKAQWETERIERRLAEAITLSVSGKLDVKNQTEIKTQFEKQVEKVTEHVGEFESQNPELAREINSRFEATLDVHEEVLAHIRSSDSKDSNANDILNTLREKRGKREKREKNLKENATTMSFEVPVEERTKTAAPALELESTEVSTEETSLTVRKSAAERIGKEAKSELEHMLKFIKEIEKGFTSGTVEQAKIGLKDAQALLKDAEVAFEMEEYDLAFSYFQDILNSTYRLQVLLRAEQKHGINVFSETEFEIEF